MIVEFTNEPAFNEPGPNLIWFIEAKEYPDLVRFIKEELTATGSFRCSDLNFVEFVNTEDHLLSIEFMDEGLISQKYNSANGELIETTIPASDLNHFYHLLDSLLKDEKSARPGYQFIERISGSGGGILEDINLIINVR